MDAAIKEIEIGDFTDKEIRAEYEDRFGAPDSPDLKDFTSSDLIDELEDRGTLPDAEAPEGLDEIADLIAEAARTSPYARRAYGLLRNIYPNEIPDIAARQALIQGRMGGLPL